MKSMQKGDVFGLVVSEAESHVLLGALAFGECGCPGRLCVLGCQRLCLGDYRAGHSTCPKESGNSRVFFFPETKRKNTYENRRNFQDFVEATLFA